MYANESPGSGRKLQRPNYTQTMQRCNVSWCIDLKSLALHKQYSKSRFESDRAHFVNHHEWQKPFQKQNS